MKILYCFVAAILILVTGALIFGPIDNSDETSRKVTGIVTNVYEGGVKDAVFDLKNDKISYYINRGLENRFTLEKLNNDFSGKEVTVFYASGWTPFAPFGITAKHINRLECNGKVIYTEF